MLKLYHKDSTIAALDSWISESSIPLFWSGGSRIVWSATSGIFPFDSYLITLWEGVIGISARSSFDLVAISLNEMVVIFLLGNFTWAYPGVIWRISIPSTKKLYLYYACHFRYTRHFTVIQDGSDCSAVDLCICKKSFM